MNNQFIQRVIFDWNRIDNDSYLKGIEAFKGIEKLDFNKPITFFVGENGSGKSSIYEGLKNLFLASNVTDGNAHFSRHLAVDEFINEYTSGFSLPKK